MSDILVTVSNPEVVMMETRKFNVGFNISNKFEINQDHRKQ